MIRAHPNMMVFKRKSKRNKQKQICWWIWCNRKRNSLRYSPWLYQTTKVLVSLYGSAKPNRIVCKTLIIINNIIFGVCKSMNWFECSFPQKISLLRVKSSFRYYFFLVGNPFTAHVLLFLSEVCLFLSESFKWNCIIIMKTFTIAYFSFHKQWQSSKRNVTNVGQDNYQEEFQLFGSFSAF